MAQPVEKFGFKNICPFYITSKHFICHNLKPKTILFPFTQNELEVAMHILINLKLLMSRAKCHTESFIRRSKRQAVNPSENLTDILV